MLENAFRNFSCLTKGDTFTFEYNDQTYDIAVLEIKPDTESHSIVTMETDLEVDFATPVGYVAPERTSGTSTPRSGIGKPHGGPVHFQGTMAQSINYESIAPATSAAAAGARAVSSHFLSEGHKLSSKKGAKAPTPNPSTPVAGSSTNTKPAPSRKTNGPQPLRLPPGKLFFGYEVKPLRKKDQNGEPVGGDELKPKFQGQGQTLRQMKRAAGGGADSGPASSVNSDAEGKAKPKGTGGKR